MKQNLLNQMKLEAKYLTYAEKIQPKVVLWLGYKSLNPVEILEIYFKYIARMKFTYKYAKIVRGQFKIKIEKEPLGSKNPFDLANIRHVYKKEKQRKC